MNKRLKYFFAYSKVLLLLSFSLIISCADETAQDSDKIATEPSYKLSLGIAMQPTSALAIIAMEQDYFRNHHIDIEVTKYPSGKRALRDGLFTGQVDVATTSDMPVALAALQQHKYKIIASTFNADNINRIIARKDAGILSPEDLRGKSIATQQASAVHYFLHLFLMDNGLSETDVQLHFYKAEQLPDKLFQGEIDAFSMREPYISQAKALLADNAIIFAAPGVYSQLDVVVVSAELLQKTPTAVTHILSALLDAERYASEHPQEAIATIARHLGVSSEDIAMLWPSLKLRISLDQSLLMLLENEARWAIRSRLTEYNKTLPDYLEYIHLNSLKKLKPEAVSIIH